MPVTIIEQPDSRRWTGKCLLFHYFLFGTADEQEARNQLLAGTATVHEGLTRDENPDLDPVDAYEDADEGAWDCQVRYYAAGALPLRRRTPDPIGSIRIRGSTKGGTAHITISKETMGQLTDGSAEMETYKVIGLERDGNGEGTDVYLPVFAFSATCVYPADAGPSLNSVRALTCKTNADAFTVTDTFSGLTITLAALEGLFLGADFGDAREDGSIEITFEFLAAYHDLDWTPIKDWPPLPKNAWDVPWVRKEETVAGNYMPRKVTHAFTERVYDPGDWGLLQLT